MLTGHVANVVLEAGVPPFESLESSSSAWLSCGMHLHEALRAYLLRSRERRAKLQQQAEEHAIYAEMRAEALEQGRVLPQEFFLDELTEEGCRLLEQLAQAEMLEATEEPARKTQAEIACERFMELKRAGALGPASKPPAKE